MATALQLTLPLPRTGLRQPTARAAVAQPKVAPRRLSGLLRLFRRREPTVYERCLAVHMHFASRASALD